MPVLWERPEPRGRTANPIDRRAIANAAVALADAQGLAEVSIRKVAAELGCSPMRLYGYIKTKDELHDLMLDQAYAEILQAGRPERRWGWRRAITAIAVATREVALRHEWIVDLIGGRPPLGPNGLAVMEATAAAIDRSPAGRTPNELLTAMATLNAYLVGAVRSEVADLRTDRETGTDEPARQRSMGPYLRRSFASGALPTVQKMITAAEEPSPEEQFRNELELILDAIGRR